MIKSFGSGNESHQHELSSLVAKEVQRVLAQCDGVVRAHILTSSPVGIDNNAAADLLSATHQQAIYDDLAGLASEFVQRLATEATRRFDAGVGGMPPEVGQGRAAVAAGDPQCGSMRIEDWAGQVAGPTYLEKRFGMPRSTLHWWQRHNDVIALRKGARKHVFPLAQFIDGRPAPGIRQVLSSIANPRLAWLWLICPSPLLGDRVPMEMLRQDLTAEVVSAARSFASMKSN
ncbi:antitoxin Xre/MbcA/ParS-like domain-containing protein [Mesorhizobium sp. ArgA1]